MSLLWNIVTNRNDPSKTKLEQFKSSIQKLELDDLELLLQECQDTDFCQVIMELITVRSSKKPTLI